MKPIQTLVEIIQSVGAVIHGDHFVLATTDGKHSSTYVDENTLFQNNECLESLANILAIRTDHTTELVVFLPEHQALIHYLSKRMRTLRSGNGLPEFICLERTERGVVQVPEDTHPTLRTKSVELCCGVLYDEPSSQVYRAMDAILSAGGTVKKVYALWNAVRAMTFPGMETEISASIHDYIATYSQNVCPMCESGMAINTHVGFGSDFLRNLGQ